MPKTFGGTSGNREFCSLHGSLGDALESLTLEFTGLRGSSRRSGGMMG